MVFGLSKKGVVTMLYNKMNLYEIYKPGYEKLKCYPINVKRRKKTYNFEVYESYDAISTFYIDDLGRKRVFVNMEELERMLVI